MDGEKWLRANYRYEEKELDKYLLPKSGYFDPTYIDPKKEPRMNSTVIDELEFTEDFDDCKRNTNKAKRVYRKKNTDFWFKKANGEFKKS